MELVELIPIGKDNRINRHDLADRFIVFGAMENIGDVNRKMMLIIEELRKTDVIISSGSGYYRPETDEIDELENYIEKEESRANKIRANVTYAKKRLADMKAGRI